MAAALKSSLTSWQTRSLPEVEGSYTYLEALALWIRSGDKVASVPVLAVGGVLADGQKVLEEEDLCRGES